MNKLTQRVMARVLAGTVIVTSVVGGSAVSEETARLLGKQLTGKAHEVATFVKNSLGLSVPALAFLMEIDPTVVHRKSYLVDSGRMRFIDELDRAGLIDAEELSLIHI